MSATSGAGTKFRRWNASATSAAGAWETIGNITGISGPDASRETIDTTTLDSVAGYREFIPSLRDAGSMSLTMNFSRDTYDMMKADFESDNLQNYQIVLPDSDSTTLEFEGMVTEIPLEIPLDDKISADVTIKISGEVTVDSGGDSGSDSGSDSDV
jgi:predicted secreted protein